MLDKMLFVLTVTESKFRHWLHFNHILNHAFKDVYFISLGEIT